MTLRPTAPAPSSRVVTSAGFRPDVQALRALAVSLVVVYHLWPNRVPGGYVGVDVFFVISGFLITSHLVGELARTGTISLPSFWARRIRRLLPASLTVLAAALGAALIWVPDSLLQQNLREIGASAVYVVNWTLAADAVNYLSAENLPSLVQHYWSLSVEEQFYLAWPVLIVLSAEVVGFVARRTGRERPAGARVAIFWVLAVVFAASLAYSIFLTHASQAAAYFNTFARAWEFAAGGLAATILLAWPKLGHLVPARWAPAVGEAATWLGIALIAFSALRFSDGSAFPGYIALLPVAGAVLVLAGGGIASRRWPAARVAGLWPIQRIGDLSYGIYLWHWPLIALYPFVFGTPFGSLGAAVMVFLSVGLAALSKYFIEDPVRTGGWWRARRWRAFALAGAGAALLIGVGSVQSASIDVRKAEASVRAQEQLDSGAPCFGARAMDPAASCPGRTVLSASTDLAFAATDLDHDWCAAKPGDDWKTCEYGDTTSPSRTIALVGDSHAAAMVPAFQELATERGWRLITYLQEGCPGVSVSRIEFPGRPLDEQDSCAAWTTRVFDELTARTDIDGVVFVNFSDRSSDPVIPYAGRVHAADLAAEWNRISASGKRVVLVRDIPDTHMTNIPACLALSFVKSAPCAFPRGEAVVDSQVIDAVSLADNARLVDMSDFFCDATLCYAVMGDVVVYADDNHISGTYAKTLAPYLGKELEDAFEFAG
ncbi:acyltransferase family protein [soil metagenome]